jgi:methylated-DNA-[protein]-cysteine S-methyltransferase
MELEMNAQNEKNCCSLTLSSPLGNILVQGSHTHIQTLKFVDDPFQYAANSEAGIEVKDALWFEPCRLQLEEYFLAQRQSFDLPIELIGSEFQTRVWKTLTQITYAETASYRDIARLMANDKAVRAVASANANNPIWLIIPCHRIIGTDSALRGYAGGIERKARLLALEGHKFNQVDFSKMNEKTKVIR